MATIKPEPVDLDEPFVTVNDDDCDGNGSGGGAAATLLMMENSAAVCIMEEDHQQQDLMAAVADNDQAIGGGCGSREEEEEKVQLQQQPLQIEDDDKLMMQTDEDPLLQETINALMNGTGGIEAVPGPSLVNGEMESDRNYECNYCGKLFTRSNTLSYHLKVHNDEKPYKCGTCDKAFREQYRLTKHQRTHEKDMPAGVQNDQEADHSQDSSFPSTSGRTGDDEDYTTGDSERFFKNYDLQEGEVAMKLEPDISLTVESSSTNPTTQSSSSDNDVRYQIIEERIKSLQREVHLVNQNLNRVENKLDGLTKILAIFMNKFEEVEPPPATTLSSNSNAMIPLPLISVPLETLAALQQQQQQPPQQATITVSPTTSQATQSIQIVHPTSTATVSIQEPTAAQATIQQQLDAAASNGITTFVGSAATVGDGGGGGRHYSSNYNDTFPEVPELPIRTVNDFLDLNDHCTDNEQFLLQMMIRLHQEVDQSQPHQRNVKKMMEALVTYEVLCQFSWSGKSAINGQYTKYVFGNSVGIIDLLTKTLNLGKSDEEAEANRKPIFTAIQSFIKHSRQNMLRESRKRRESSTVYPTAMVCTVDRQMKVIKAEKQDVINQY